MKIFRSSATCVLLFHIAGAPALAEDVDGDTQAYTDNYRFTLVYTSAENETTTAEFVVAGKRFELDSYQPTIRFEGSIVSVDRNSIVLLYNLGLQKTIATGTVTQGNNGNPFHSMQTVRGGLRSNVRLKLGEPVTLLKVGDESARLTVERLN